MYIKNPNQVIYFKNYNCKECNSLLRSKSVTIKEYFEKQYANNPLTFDSYFCEIYCSKCKSSINILTYKVKLGKICVFGDCNNLDKEIINLINSSCDNDSEYDDEDLQQSEFGKIKRDISGKYTFYCNKCSQKVSRNQILNLLDKDKFTVFDDIKNTLSVNDRLLFSPPTDQQINQHDTSNYDDICSNCKLNLFIQRKNERESLIAKNLCPICEKKKQDGVWCSLDCAIKFVRIYNEAKTCPYCNKKITDDEKCDYHHLFYSPEIIINMHQKCHRSFQHSKNKELILDNFEKRKTLKPTWKKKKVHK